MKHTLFAAGFALATAVGTANANPLTIDGGFAGVIPGALENTALDFFFGDGTFGSGGMLGGYFGSTILLSSSNDIKVEILAKEGTATNTFSYGGTSTPFTAGTFLPADPTAIISQYVAAADKDASNVLNFSFDTSLYGGVTVTNGSNPDNSLDTEPNFFASFGPGKESDRSGSSLWLFFDDAGAGDDDNHDDYVVRISAVPLPAAGLMLMGGLAGLGFVGRRRKKA